MADERRLEGIPFGRRAGGARDIARHERASMGLQRPVAGPDHRSGRGRQGPHLRHQQIARAHHHPLARHAAAERHGRRRRPEPAAHQAGQDLRLRICAEEKRNLHVPPSRRRDGADGDGHDGLLRRPSARPEAASRRPRFRFPAQRIRHRSRRLCAEDHDHDRLQSEDMEQQGLSRHRPRWWCAREIACGCASAI